VVDDRIPGVGILERAELDQLFPERLVLAPGATTPSRSCPLRFT
jgi:hypothetical protein